MTYVHEYASPLGTLTIASDGGNITGLWKLGQKYYGQTLPKDASARHVPVFDLVGLWLDEYFNGSNPRTNLPLAPPGSRFRQEIWNLLLDVPYGETTTYGDIAKIIAGRRRARTMSAQAVGGAVGHNPISIIIPCHRVLGGSGSLTGYAGGLAMKQWLLNHERSRPPQGR
ncbi:MAG: methylated-DNA--[protein]-cysteine S-methyltransferase [Planctomycetota bacterium]|nr:methylated-DNA--[protein]-cysteine S-methyltransferase [Planctomycetota bacterium]